MKRHRENADQYRALAALARSQGQASALGNVNEAHGRAAARWDALAALEDMYLAHAEARGGRPVTWTGPLSRVG
ncbi:hypothetical protein [Phenylobacterium sp.]|jgi:hypothetical protein|uniref:hypothetical protein n=1 Tax=Phenylobacterium sp. TaxID=1871053 RepID=UPI002E320846|nr:hypothetical protein [Phenylobacterium sp.]HEX2560396.1 hypothetical protein [Phenylobacterium sp.]